METETKKEKRMYSVEEAAQYLGLAPRTLYNGTGKKSKAPFPIRPRRIGRKVLFDVKDLDKFIDSLETHSS